MPASRKRNKGKDRKARQQAKKEENERSIANTLWRGLCNAGIGCEHGCGAMISNDHPVSTFMDQFIMNLDKGNENFALLVSETLKDSFKSHIQIWNDESYRRLAIIILIRIGTNRYCMRLVQNSQYALHTVLSFLSTMMVRVVLLPQ